MKAIVKVKLGVHMQTSHFKSHSTFSIVKLSRFKSVGLLKNHTQNCYQNRSKAVLTTTFQTFGPHCLVDDIVGRKNNCL